MMKRFGLILVLKMIMNGDIEIVSEEHQSSQQCLYVPEEMSHGLNGIINHRTTLR